MHWMKISNITVEGSLDFNISLQNLRNSLEMQGEGKKNLTIEDVLFGVQIVTSNTGKRNVSTGIIVPLYLYKQSGE